jgi:hypothetical protein
MSFPLLPGWLETLEERESSRFPGYLESSFKSHHGARESWHLENPESFRKEHPPWLLVSGMALIPFSRVNIFG